MSNNKPKTPEFYRLGTALFGLGYCLCGLLHNMQYKPFDAVMMGIFLIIMWTPGKVWSYLSSLLGVKS